VLGKAATGSGKTLAFGLPLLARLAEDVQRGPRAPRGLVLVPTRELAQQVADNLAPLGQALGLFVSTVYGGAPMHRQIQQLRRGVDVVIATPGRLLDLMEQGHINLRNVEILILDEADQMLDMGFIIPLRRIVAAVPKERQTLMFSATMPTEIRRLASEWLSDPTYIQIGPVATPIELVEQSVYFVEPRQKPYLLTHFLQNNSFTRTIVFARTKHGADKIVKHLDRSGIRAAAIHGNKSQSVRQRTLAAFKSNRPPVLVATDIAARGLDISNVSHVINYELPEVPEVYVHRIGRTGRAGATGIATSFCSRDERGQLRQIEQLTHKSLNVESDHPDYSQIKSPTHNDQANHNSRDSGATHASRARRPGRGPKKSRGKAPRKQLAAVGVIGGQGSGQRRRRRRASSARRNSL
jgi:ATP-dependent RNA helicase RhlE